MKEQRLIVVLFFGLVCFACKKTASSVVVPDPVQTPTTPPSTFAKGADVGWITEMEGAGKKFYNGNGIEQDIVLILKNLGMNSIRLRVWVNPSNGWNNKADVVAKSLRAKAQGMRLMIDFHYSDSWADPDKQTKPVAWTGQDISGLKSSL